MFEANVPEVLSRIGPDDLVLDVGGWARCFNRADYVIDKFPYETRGQRYGDRLGLGPQGGEVERFRAETWITRDLCDRERWPFPDKSFDFCTCSHTLEDIRDPLWVCSEMRRVARRGYIEAPSMLFELTRGREPGVPVGLSHHFWLVETREDTITFYPKLHSLHGNRQWSLPPSVGASLPPDRLVTWLYWDGDFRFKEGWLHPEVLEAVLAAIGLVHDDLEHAIPSTDTGAEHRVLELTLAAEEARARYWEAREQLAHATQQWEGTQGMLRVVQEQRDHALAILEEVSAQRDAMERELTEARAWITEVSSRLASLEGTGPTALRVARQLQRLAKRYPGLASIARYVLQASPPDIENEHMTNSADGGTRPSHPVRVGRPGLHRNRGRDRVASSGDQTFSGSTNGSR